MHGIIALVATVLTAIWGDEIALQLTEETVHAEAELSATTTGAIAVWVDCDIACSLRILGPDGEQAAIAQSSASSPDPFALIPATEGETFVARVATVPEGQLASASLFVTPVHETDASRALADETRLALAEARSLNRMKARRENRKQLEAIEEFERFEESELLTDALASIGALAHELGDLKTAERALAHAARGYGRTRPESDTDRLNARHQLAIAIAMQGRKAEALAIQEDLLAIRSAFLPEDDPILLKTRENVAASLEGLGRREEALALFRESLEIRERHAPFNDTGVLLTRANIASTQLRMGEATAARETLEELAPLFDESFPTTHPHLAWFYENLANAVYAEGDLLRAADIMAKVVEAQTRILPDTHPDLLMNQRRLIDARFLTGEYRLAKKTAEDAVRARASFRPDTDMGLIASRGQLGDIHARLGELTAARELYQQALDGMQAMPSPDPVEVAKMRGRIALVMKAQGEVEGAREHEEANLALFIERLPPDDTNIQQARVNLANTERALGNLDAARELELAAIEVWERTLPEGHPDLLRAWSNRAATLWATGDTAGARRIGERCLEQLGQHFPDSDLQMILGRENLARTLVSDDDIIAARQVAGDLCEVIQGATERWAATLGSREIERHVEAHLSAISTILWIAGGADRFEADDELVARSFELTESMRALGVEAARNARAAAQSPDWSEKRQTALAAETRLVRAVNIGAGRDIVAEARRESDAAWRALFDAESRPATSRSRLQTTDLAKQLDTGTKRTLVTFRRYRTLDGFDPRREVGIDWIVAYVLRPDGTLRQLTLGKADAIEELCFAWRDSIGVGSDLRAPGVTVEASPTELDTDAGVELREAILDPVLELAELAWEDRAESDRLPIVIVSDDAVSSIPLDALPSPTGGLVGDAFTITFLTSATELLTGERTKANDARLVAVGDVDFGSSRSGRNARFTELPATRGEVEAIAAMFDEERAVVMRGREATKSSLLEASAKASVLHLATHGWYTGHDASEQLTSTIPLVLCGVALSDANRLSDDQGVAAGILTGEEIADLDLRGCELAVLSACETHLGVQRAGQGVASLQRALHMAGAQAVVTSLWKVPDEPTKELMEAFYRGWKTEGKPKHIALWDAKNQLRHARDADGDPRYAPRDWAAWVLTGRSD